MTAPAESSGNASSPTRRVSIRDVAKAAGVSATVVSHVLNDFEGARVAEGTRDRVRRAATELNYSPNRLARSLRLKRTHTIAMISDEIATTPYATNIILGAQEAAYGQGWALVVVNTGHDREVQERALDLLEENQVDGVLYASMFHRVVEVPQRLADHPIVLLDARSDDTQMPAVVPDEVLGGRLAVEELIKHGHRRIGFAMNSEPIPATAGRMRGYRDALRAAGIRFDESLVVADKINAHGGYRAVTELLARDPRPTAIFCFNDQMAMGAYRALAEAGLHVPTDCSIIGFDNQEIIAEGLFPALSTVALPHYEMGAWAVNALIKQIEGVALDVTEFPVLLPCPVISRDSIAAPTTP